MMRLPTSPANARWRHPGARKASARRLVGGLALASVGALSTCSEEAVENSSYLLVELGPARTASQPPRNVQVLVAPEGLEPVPLCINIEGEADTVTASFVLSREPGRDATLPVTLTVTPYDALAGSGPVGKDFACPATMPPAVGPAQTLALSFCQGEPRRVRFEVGAVCPCPAGSGGSGGVGGSTPQGGSTSTGGAASGGGGAAGGAAGAAPTGGGGTGGAGGDGAAGGSGGSPPSCECPEGGTCGAGISPSGQACGPAECCRSSITSPCSELEAAP